MNDEILNKRLDRIERDNKKILALLTGEKKEKAWVKASTVVKLTGWNKEKMRQMRVNGIIKFKHDETGFWYDANSIPSIFIRNENTQMSGSGYPSVDHARPKTLKL